MGKREVKESPIERGIDETFPYSFTLTNKVPSGTNASPTEILYKQLTDDSEEDVTAAAMTGSPSVSSTTYTTADFVAAQLENDQRYRLNWGFTIDGKRWSWNLFINANN